MDTSICPRTSWTTAARLLAAMPAFPPRAASSRMWNPRPLRALDRISIEGLEVFANHGVFPEENSLGQKFVVV